jgi:3-oxoacyl-[acyl-carrier protein] reductase
MDLKLTGKSALVMGGSKGLGRAIAAELIAEGVRVAIASRDATRVAQAAGELGALGFTADLTQPGAGRTAVEQATSLLGGAPDILVTNTGGPKPGGFEAIGRDAWDQAFNSLWMSVIDGAQAVLPSMRERGWGRILAVTSIAAKEPQPGLVVSNSLRAGLLGLVNSLSRDVAGDGITVNALLPGYTATDRMAELGVNDATMGAKIPAGRLGRPEEFAALAAFLASDRASYITGQAIAVDGGLLNSI